MENAKSKNILTKILAILVILVIIALAIWFYKEIVIPFLKFQANNDQEGAKAFLASFGILSYVVVPIIQALQMIVVFIPAEFIQLTSGMLYPWYQSMLLCDLGVVIGSIIIYILVKFIDISIHGSSQKKIDETIARYKNKSVSLIMYFLLFLPVVPYGAVAYFASSRNIKFPKYVVTVATGVIPSLIYSTLIGNGIKLFVNDTIPWWGLVLIILGSAIFLFLVIILFLDNILLDKKDKNPTSIIYYILSRIVKFLYDKKVKVNYKTNGIENLTGSYLIVSNHTSYMDFYYLHRLIPNHMMILVANRYYMNHLLLGPMLRRSGFISKKMFDADINTILDIRRAAKKDFPIVLFPEGRLSNDGTTNHFNQGLAPLVRSLQIPLAINKIEGGYLANPKWRKRIYQSHVNCEIKKILTVEEIEKLTDEELNELIYQTMYSNDFELNKNNMEYTQIDKAVGLENMMYHCPNCHQEFTMWSFGNKVTCSNCQKEYKILDNYSFDDEEIHNIHEYLEYVKQIEKEKIKTEGVNLNLKVKAKIFNKKNNFFRIVRGNINLTNTEFTYTARQNKYSFTKKISNMEALAYSVNKEFETYNNDQLHYFYPVQNRKICTKMSIIVDCLKEIEKENNK